MNKSPRTLTINETALSSVDHFSVIARLVSDNSVVASKNYTPTGGNTVCPIGSDGFFASVNAGTQINLSVIEVGAGAAGPSAEQTVPGGPFTVQDIPDGAEGLVVTL